MKKIILAGGCFWGVQAYFRDLKGVYHTEVGYANGNKPNPTYQEVCNGVATHAEVTLVKYDETIVSLSTILEHFFRIINPYTLNRQGNDIGLQYRSGVYYESENDALVSREFIQKRQALSERKFAVVVEPLKNYYKAEEYHQDYLIKNPNGYCHVNLDLLKADERK
ncbi:peptide-methionine (S)-S-oxide reductase MsrA [Acholeplasma vituli]|uniref:Peptide methionine sulfoxide reductase MsrA n=1 Tax=Paracholeplasma vituli TaxID=69473 RepID=A0ABT2PV70_9MOLU|nr:peptide-methionine (S)-S-oxide reductase MsrA [Paracholeplasma vituli]MCU0104849.1 peptide-methionine (S)-S-oxide reductase MsrA [Paracholeplasma vituli]